MSGIDWQEVDEVFQAARDVASVAERTAWLDARCDGRPELRAEVSSLLAAYDASDAFLRPLGVAGALPPEAPRFEGQPHGTTPIAGEPVLPPDSTHDAGAVVGDWRLIRQIGQGGMGAVFLAERADGVFTQQVAIKVTRASVADRDAARRFAAERQILASFNHPHIVTLLDGGTTATGQAYLVMEHVDGVPITSWLRDRRAALDTRLRLFRQVCAGVHAAHQHGVVHRDLKPANILVTAEGAPKILDFGVAKLVDAERVMASGASLTSTGVLQPLTPNYASPEQLRGLSATTASDIYALGVLLFEMLAGARPYETASKPIDEMLRIVMAGAAQRPSAARAESQGSSLPYDRARLRGDLDTIVMKAMDVEPSRRYASAEQLADDVARYLGGKPIVAREPSLGYVLKKLAQRHRVATVTIAAAAAIVLIALATALWQRQAAVRERAAAEARFNDVRRLARALMFDVHAAVAPLPGSTKARQLITSEALGYLDRLAASRAGETGIAPDLRLELAQGYRQIAVIQGDPARTNLGDRDGALASARRALTLLEPMRGTPGFGGTPGLDRQAAAEIAKLYILIGDIEAIRGHKDLAAAARHTAVEEAKALAAAAPRDDEARRLLASAHFSMALGLGTQPEALPVWEAAGRIFDELLAEKPNDVDRLRNVALVNKYLGGWYNGQKQFDRAEVHYRRAMEIDDRTLTAHPEDRRAQFDVSIDLANLAGVLGTRGMRDEAIRLFERSVAIREARTKSDPADIQARVSLARALDMLSGWRLRFDDRAGARRDAERAIAIVEPLTTKSSDVGQRRILESARRNRAEAMAAVRPAAARPIKASR